MSNASLILLARKAGLQSKSAKKKPEPLKFVKRNTIKQASSFSSLEELGLQLKEAENKKNAELAETIKEQILHFALIRSELNK